MVLMNALPETNIPPLKIGLLPRKTTKNLGAFAVSFQGRVHHPQEEIFEPFFVGGFSVGPSGGSLWQVVWVSLASDSPTRTLSWSHALKFLTRWWQLKYFFFMFIPTWVIKWSNLTTIFKMGWFNHHLVKIYSRNCRASLIHNNQAAGVKDFDILNSYRRSNECEKKTPWN